MEVVNDFKDYEIIDSSNGEKLERWENIYLLRPDPQIIWDNGDLFSKYHDLIQAFSRTNRILNSVKTK